MLIVKEAVADKEINYCFNIRESVFINEQQVPPNIERDCLDKTAVHFIAIDDGFPVGTARVVIDGDDVAIIGRVAVLKDYRGKGIGKKIIQAIETADSMKHVKIFKMHAQTQAINFYIGLGYEPYGDEYVEADMPHKNVRKVRIGVGNNIG